MTAYPIAFCNARMPDTRHRIRNSRSTDLTLPRIRMRFDRDVRVYDKELTAQDPYGSSTVENNVLALREQMTQHCPTDIT